MDANRMRQHSSLPEQAAHWFQRINAPNCTPREREQFDRWRLADPAHAKAYERAAYLYRRTADLRLDPKWRAEARIAREETARAARHRRWLLAGTAAATLLIAFQLAWHMWNRVEFEQHLITAVGERRTALLVDGSRVLLDADTAMDVRYTRHHRDVVLERGQAEFSVAKAPTRPFVVQAGAGTVRAVGTEFQVRKDGSTVAVTLLKGVVTVRADEQGTERTATLTAGEQLQFDDHTLGAPTPADMAAATGWTHGDLIFDHRPLAEIIAEMNRYSTVKIRLGDPSLGDLPITGAFYDNDQSSLIQALQMGWQLQADRVSADEIMLKRKRE